MTDEPRKTLGETGQVYVTHEAAVAYARATDLALEPARRDLTELLLDAKQSAADPSEWRFRRRSAGLDIGVKVARGARLLIVTHVIVRTRP